MHCFIVASGIVSVTSGLCSPALAQDNPAMQVDVSRCVVIASADLRYRCFDEVTAHLRSKVQVTTSTPAQKEEVSAPAEQAQRETIIREFGRDSATAEVKNNDDGNAELRDTIAHLEEREPGRWLVTLNSGQVWYQDTAGRVRLKEGMKVRIYPSNFGSSYRLAADEINGVIQVRRIK